jgi:Fe-S-cluster containining protein
VIIHFITLLDYINATFINSKKMENWVWIWLKTELFHIQGQCQHSGQCCTKIMVFSKDIPLNTADTYAQFNQKHPTLPFVPKYNDVTPTKIDHFTCKNLTSVNTCKDYDNRPQTCRNYPHSNLLSETPLFKKCGYSIHATPLPAFAHSSLKNKVQAYNQKMGTIPMT